MQNASSLPNIPKFATCLSAIKTWEKEEILIPIDKNTRYVRINRTSSQGNRRLCH